MCFGSSGMFEQDDVENWVSITQMARGTMARRLHLNSRDGPRPRGPARCASRSRTWPGPGAAFVGFGEYNQRELLNAVEPLPRGRERAPARVRRVATRVTMLPFSSAEHQRGARVPRRARPSCSTSGGSASGSTLLAADVVYVMPVRVTAPRERSTSGLLEDMAHFDEDRYSLRKRVERFETEHAWTEDPPSRTRHLVTNVRTLRRAPRRTSSSCESYVLLFRSRGDIRDADLVSAEPARPAAADGRTACGSRGARSWSTSPCCAPRTSRSSCDGRARD